MSLYILGSFDPQHSDKLNEILGTQESSLRDGEHYVVWSQDPETGEATGQPALIRRAVEDNNVTYRPIDEPTNNIWLAANLDQQRFRALIENELFHFKESIGIQPSQESLSNATSAVSLVSHVALPGAGIAAAAIEPALSIFGGGLSKDPDVKAVAAQLQSRGATSDTLRPSLIRQALITVAPQYAPQLAAESQDPASIEKPADKSTPFLPSDSPDDGIASIPDADEFELDRSRDYYQREDRTRPEQERTLDRDALEFEGSDDDVADSLTRNELTRAIHSRSISQGLEL